MALKVTHTTTYLIPNPPTIEEYAENYVPDSGEIATAPSILNTSIIELYEQGKQEYLNSLPRATAEESTITGDGKNVLVEEWANQAEFEQQQSISKAPFDYAASNVSDAVKVYYRIRAQYFKEYVANVTVATESI